MCIRNFIRTSKRDEREGQSNFFFESFVLFTFLVTKAEEKKFSGKSKFQESSQSEQYERNKLLGTFDLNELLNSFKLRK